MKLKHGDIVRIKPACCFPDESPEQLYKIVQTHLESYANYEKIDCMMISSFNIPPIMRIQMSDLELVESNSGV